MAKFPIDPSTVQPAPDEATEQTWAEQILSKGREMITDWRETEIAYQTMVAARAEFGVPLIGNGWSQEQDDQFWLVHYVVLTLSKYLSEIDEGTRNIAYDTFGDQVAILGDLGDLQIDYTDGILSIKRGDQVTSIDSSGFTGLGPAALVAIVVVGAAVQITGIVMISRTIRDYISRVVQKDAIEHEEKIAQDIISKGGDPADAHKKATEDTQALLKSLEEKARSDAEGEEKKEFSQLASVIKTVAYVGLAAVVIGGILYYGAPLLQRSSAESRQLARQNPTNPTPIDGYGYVMESPSKDWKRISDERWETEVFDVNSDGPYTFVGTRRIDMALCNVWKRSDGKYVAQLEHMTRGERENPIQGWQVISWEGNKPGKAVWFVRSPDRSMRDEALRIASNMRNDPRRGGTVEVHPIFSGEGLYGEAKNPRRRAKTETVAPVTQGEKEDAIRLWRGQCDPHSDGENFEFEKMYGKVFITGTVWDGRRVTVQVGWDDIGPFAWNGDKYRWYPSEMRPAGQLVLQRRNPTRGKAVAEHGGYVWGSTYEVWDEETLEAGDTDDRGWEHEYEDNGPYKSLADLLQDIPGHSWLEWSSSDPGPRDWIISEDDQDYRSGDRTQYSLHIKHADGTPLTQSEVNFIDSKIFGARKRHVA